MKVTEIKAQVKTAGRFSIFVDGRYAFSLSDTALLEEKLHIGQELDAAEVKRLEQVSSDDKLYGHSLHYVSMRPRSEWEIRGYLQRKNVSPALVDQILSKLSKLGMVDDVKFARAWVESRRLLRPTSKRKLQQELRAKNVSNEVISQVLAEDETDERATLRELVAKKRARYPDKLKLMQYLARQGFGYNDIKEILEESDDD
jgi:regulatory protein